MLWLSEEHILCYDYIKFWWNPSQIRTPRKSDFHVILQSPSGNKSKCVQMCMFLFMSPMGLFHLPSWSRASPSIVCGADSLRGCGSLFSVLACIRVDTLAGLIQPSVREDGYVAVDMGEPVFAPEKIPTTLPANNNGKVVAHQMEVPSHSVVDLHVSLRK